LHARLYDENLRDATISYDEQVLREIGEMSAAVYQGLLAGGNSSLSDFVSP
jgi:hypothetical protein